MATIPTLKAIDQDKWIIVRVVRPEIGGIHPWRARRTVASLAPVDEFWTGEEWATRQGAALAFDSTEDAAEYLKGYWMVMGEL
ncbi:MAG: hypothetical protein QGG71_01970 [Pirellulaceae bacterium]|jgi:hypothetical protein|nr:hypothetical protein [Pirellulaceae bacterium]